MKVITLLSGGIDSPVAAHLLKAKGCEVIAVHFFNKTRFESGVKNKIHQLAEKLGIKLLIVPFKDVQFEIIKNVPAKFRMVIYRRMMFRIADKIRERQDADALATGDCLGQVASQTLENLKASYSAVKCPVLHPLIGVDKKDITEIAKKIETYEISAMSYEDCCSFMIAKHPVTKADVKEIEQMESKLQINELVDNAISQLEVL